MMSSLKRTLVAGAAVLCASPVLAAGLVDNPRKAMPPKYDETIYLPMAARGQ